MRGVLLYKLPAIRGPTPPTDERAVKEGTGKRREGVELIDKTPLLIGVNWDRDLRKFIEVVKHGWLIGSLKQLF